MATASSAFAELSAHTLQLAVLDGRRITALRAFSLDAKADIAAFVAEHRLAGVARVALLGANNFLHPSTEAETTALRQPAALLAHAAQLPHGFDGTPFTLAVDAGTGLLPDAAGNAPWILAAVASAEVESAKTRLGELGLAPAAVTLAAIAQLGAVSASLPAGDTVLVLLPGENTAHLAWVTAGGAQALAIVPVGYAQIFEAVQTGLGLKFKAAAGKLFYNENYDFADAAPKVADSLAPAIRSFLADAAATHLHIAGLTPAQAWLVNSLAASLQLSPWSPAAPAGLDLAAVTPAAAATGVLFVAAAGDHAAPWIQPSLDTLAAKAKPAPAPPVAATSAAPKPARITPPSAPAPKPAASAPKPAPVIESVTATTKPPAPAAPRAHPPVARKGKTGPIIIATTVGVVAAVVGVAAYFGRPAHRPNARPGPKPVATESAPAAPAPAPQVQAAPAPSTDDQLADQPSAYANPRYRFEVSDKGFIQALSSPGHEILVESAAGITLQGSYVGTDGRRKWFNVGGVDDAGYIATVKKSVQAGLTVFDVKVTHPRFELSQSFTCLPDSVKVAARFTPLDLRDPRGVIAAVHSVRLSPVALDPSVRMSPAPDHFTYALKTGPLAIAFDNFAWARDGANGLQTVVAGENSTAFHFTDTADTARNQLTYVLRLP